MKTWRQEYPYKIVLFASMGYNKFHWPRTSFLLVFHLDFLVTFGYCEFGPHSSWLFLLTSLSDERFSCTFLIPRPLSSAFLVFISQGSDPLRLLSPCWSPSTQLTSWSQVSMNSLTSFSHTPSEFWVPIHVWHFGISHILVSSPVVCCSVFYAPWLHIQYFLYLRW